ncbi:hypothetical protein [Rhodococcus cercidiphylli]|jgi:hypothetical protein|uniref:Uncharacterized protein n=1 Tax=Rhodococcus cercidiphylli TaxID=489916 RepID=A0ABU4AX95_9NOCA|nr:hypothetical protein [Rhodococcus cercidiphylli]MDV6230864.1 hypothetical protein [Rhodococcus cercidiphylli]
MSALTEAIEGAVELSNEEYDGLFDRIARKNMGISGPEFLDRWDSGDYEGRDWDSVSGLRAVAMSLPLVR